MHADTKDSIYAEALSLSKTYYNGDELAASTFLNKYALRDNDQNLLEKTPDDMHRRIAREFARIEANKFKKPLTENEIYESLKGFRRIIPQGSPMYGIGNQHQYISLSNCYVVPSPADAYSSILLADQHLVQISKRRGGVGIDISRLRPKGTPTHNAARTSSGIGAFMERYSNSIREVGQSGRRGALMITISVHHPEIETFAVIKNDDKKVTGANVSIRLTNEFLQAVLKDEEYEQRWPCTAEDANSLKTAFPKISKKVRARDVWDVIIKSAHNRAEPGLLFWDNIINESPAACYKSFGFEELSTNPCSELPLPAFDSCRLLLLNCYSYVREPFKTVAYFDWKSFYEDAQLAQRLMDDMIDLELECIDRIIKKIDSDPEDKATKAIELEMWHNIHKTCKQGRRTGTGITGIADAMAALGIRYGSDDSIQFTDRTYKTLKFGAYRASVDMAVELGAFAIWDHNLEKNNPFINRFKEETVALSQNEDTTDDSHLISGQKIWDDMKKYGRRNIALLTTAPAGTVSLMTQTTSGIEPLFMTGYIRRRKVVGTEQNARVDFIDALGDKWTEFMVYHPKIAEWMEATGETDITKSPWHGCCAEDIDWKQRVILQAKANTHVDHAISSCLAGQSAIQTTDGLLNIDEIVTQSDEDTFSSVQFHSVNKDGRIAEISSGYNNGYADTLKIDTSSGRNITCTPNHKLVVLTADYDMIWKEAHEIQTGDWLVGRKGLHLANDEPLYINSVCGKWEYARFTNAKDIKQLRRMTPSLARLMGYLASDGSVGQNGISLCQVTNNVGPHFAKLINELFGVECSPIKDGRADNLFNWTANSREIAAFMRHLGMKDHDHLVVPEVIRRSGGECIKEFIRGATLDGHVAANGVGVATSVSLRYLEQLRDMLLNCGIEARIHQCSKEGERLFPHGKFCKTQAAYVLFISHSQEVEKFAQIGFAEDRKNEELLSRYKRPSRIKVSGEIPDFSLRLMFRQQILPTIRSQRIYDMAHTMSCADKQGRLINRQTLMEMSDLGLQVKPALIDPTYTFTMVETVSFGGYQHTYDLSVADGNSYIANGFISHNTINLPEDVLVDKVKEIYETAWQYGCKGITVYRKNCRTGVLVDKKTEAPKNGIIKTEAPKRPAELPCDVHHIRVKGKEYFVLVGLYGDTKEPYEVFAGLNGHIGKSVKNGMLMRKTRGDYRVTLDDGTEIPSVSEYIEDNEEAITRLTSTALRHGADISFIVHQLEKTKGEMQSFGKAMARALKKYIPDGTEVKGEPCGECGANLVRESGCVICKNCGWSRCT